MLSFDVFVLCLTLMKFSLEPCFALNGKRYVLFPTGAVGVYVMAIEWQTADAILLNLLWYKNDLRNP